MSWYENAIAEAQTFFDDEPRSDQILASTTRAALAGFDALFKDVMRKAKIRDDWDDTKCYIFPHSTDCLMRSLKMGVEFKLGISIYGWFIDCPLDNPDHIRSMKDDFWAQIASLSDLGTAEFHDYGRPVGWASSPEAKRLSQHSGSLVFAIARDYTMLVLNGDEDTFLTVGGISVMLPLDKKEDEVYAFFRSGLEAMYRINYFLYRSAYIRSKRLDKQRQKEKEA